MEGLCVVVRGEAGSAKAGVPTTSLRAKRSNPEIKIYAAVSGLLRRRRAAPRNDGGHGRPADLIGQSFRHEYATLAAALRVRSRTCDLPGNSKLLSLRRQGRAMRIARPIL